MMNLLFFIWNIFFEIVLFNLIKDEDFLFVFEVVFVEDLVEVEVVVINFEVFSFVNIIEGLMCIGKVLDCVVGVFYIVVGVDSNLVCEEIMCEMFLKFVVYGLVIYGNK